jgi:hypothetical protein
MAKGQYIRVYHELKDEYPGVWRSDAQLASFVRLLMIADKWWPQWAPLPFGRPTFAYRSLIECGLVVLSPDGNGFSIKGLEKDRDTRSRHGRHAAGIRWSNAPSNAQPMPSKAEQSKAEQSNGQSPTQLFMGYRPKTNEHFGQHEGCGICAPLREAQP